MTALTSNPTITPNHQRPVAHAVLQPVASLNLAAVGTAVSCSRLFIRHTLGSWNLSDHIDSAELIVSELVTNAVKMTGLMVTKPSFSELENLNLIGVRVLVHGDGLCIQVWDASVEPPTLSAAGPDDDAESGRGLFIVASLARRIGHFYPKTGGKVVWAEIALDVVVPPLPRREAKKQTTISLPRSDPELLRAVLEGLRSL